MSYYPPPPPPPPPPAAPGRRSRGKTVAFSFLGVLAFLIVISVVAAAVGGGDDTAAPADSSAPAAPAKGDADEKKADKPDDKPAAEPEEKPEPQREEADDLTSIKLDDRSEYGLTDIWVTYTVKNHSSKASDYLIKYEVTDSSGTRVYNDELYVTNVKPGQTANEEMFTTLETMEGVKLTVTGIDRTEAW